MLFSGDLNLNDDAEMFNITKSLYRVIRMGFFFLIKNLSGM